MVSLFGMTWRWIKQPCGVGVKASDHAIVSKNTRGFFYVSVSLRMASAMSPLVSLSALRASSAVFPV